MQKLDGTVTTIGAPSSFRAPMSWPTRILIGLFFVIFLPVFFVVKMLLRALSGKDSNRRPGFVNEILRRLASDYAVDRFVRNPPMKRTQDMRLIDRSGSPRAARIEGMFVTGSITTGDRVELEGVWDGTLFLVRKGWNASTHTPLQILT